MEPSPSLEEEFQQWYDTEHFPERVATDGFLTATRGICVDGWPRYIALYDLADVSVLRGDGYAKIAGDSYSRWTGRIVSRVWGQYRAEAVQVYPGSALLGAKGAAARIVLWRFRNGHSHILDDVIAGFRSLYEDQPETAQVRVFEAKHPEGVDYIGIVELHAPWHPPSGAVKAFGKALQHLDMVNTYVRYQRRWAGDFPKGT